jgi:hypothetical protein
VHEFGAVVETARPVSCARTISMRWALRSGAPNPTPIWSPKPRATTWHRPP